MAGQNNERAVLIGSAFAVGLVTGLFLKGTVMRLFERARAGQWHRELDETVIYEENLPDQLERREPAQQPGQPRFGGTGAIGVSPAAASSSVGRTAKG